MVEKKYKLEFCFCKIGKEINSKLKGFHVHRIHMDLSELGFEGNETVIYAPVHNTSITTILDET